MKTAQLYTRLAKPRYLLYGVALGLLVFILKWLEWKYLIFDNALDVYTGLIAVFFTALGVWVATQLAKPKVETVIIEKEVLVHAPATSTINQKVLNELSLSSREYEVLQLLTQGCSNTEIAEQLFLSLSTVKTHASNLFVKMDVKSRTQAIEKAKRLQLVL